MIKKKARIVIMFVLFTSYIITGGMKINSKAQTVKTISNDNNVQIEGWLKNKKRTYYMVDGKCITGLKKIGEHTYYFGPKGVMWKKRWVCMGNIKRYFNYKGQMVKNKVVDLRMINKKGIYKIGEREKIEKMAVKWVDEAVTAEKSKKAKLRACYNYMKKCQYTSCPELEEPNAITKYNGWDIVYARKMFTTRQGNCFSFASAFAFMARQIGYETKVVVGTASTMNGSVNKHAWVVIDGKIYDPSREASIYHPFGVFGKTYKTAPYKYKKQFSI